jgi:hypothetical protein
MGLSRKKAIKRILGLLPRIEEHLAKIAADPANSAFRHWVHETHGWIEQVEAVLPVVGAKTAEEWQGRIDGWRILLGDRDDT